MWKEQQDKIKLIIYMSIHSDRIHKKGSKYYYKLIHK